MGEGFSEPSMGWMVDEMTRERVGEKVGEKIGTRPAVGRVTE